MNDVKLQYRQIIKMSCSLIFKNYWYSFFIILSWGWGGVLKT